jgi:hypothetical protein
MVAMMESLNQQWPTKFCVARSSRAQLWTSLRPPSDTWGRRRRGRRGRRGRGEEEGRGGGGEEGRGEEREERITTLYESHYTHHTTRTFHTRTWPLPLVQMVLLSEGQKDTLDMMQNECSMSTV